jgi:hypothetical protein
MSSPQTVLVSFELALGDVVLDRPPRVSNVHITPAAPAPPPEKEAPVVTALRHLLDLTRNEARALARMLEHGHATKEELHAAVSGTGAPVTKLKGIDVLVFKLRRKLDPHGIEISTVWAGGYKLDKISLSAVKKLLSKHMPPVGHADPQQQVADG